jgi:hypothetical protein
MSKIKLDSPFVSYDFDPEEEMSAKILGELNRQMIQNLLFKVTMERVNLEWLPENEKREAVLTGKIEVLREILDEHDQAVNLQSAAHRYARHPTTTSQGMPIHDIFPHPGIRAPGGEIVRPESSSNPSDSE